MYTLSKCKNNRIYHKRSYQSIVQPNVINNTKGVYTENTKDDKKEIQKLRTQDCIIGLVSTIDEFVELLDSNLFHPSYYKYMYMNKNYILPNGTKKRVQSIKSTYSSINKRIKKAKLFRNNISEYQHKNVFLSAHTEIEAFNHVKMYSKEGDSTIKYYKWIDNLMKILSSVDKQYKNICIYVPILPNNSTKSTYTMMSRVLTKIKYRKYFMDKLLNDTTFEEVYLMYYNTTYEMTYSFNLLDEKIDFRKCNRMIKAISILTKSDINNNELVAIDSKTKDNSKTTENGSNMLNSDTYENRSMRKVNNTMNNIKKSLDINDSSSLNTTQVQLLDKMEDIAISKATNEEEKDKKETINSTDKEEKPDIAPREEDDSNTSLLNQLSNDKDFLDALEELKNIQKNGEKSAKEQKTINELRKQQENANLDISNTTLGKISNRNSTNKINDILNDYKSTSIDTHKLGSTRKDILDSSIQKSSVHNFDKTYMEKTYPKDILNVFTSFNEDPDIQVFVTDIQVENTSDEQNEKQTLTVSMKDSLGKKHTLKVDIPIVKDNVYMYLNGSKKLIQKQILLKPIVKIKSNEVQVTSNYNKCFIRRFGQKLSAVINVYEKFLKTEGIFDNYYNEDTTLKYQLGDVSHANKTFKLNIMYGYFSEYLWKLSNDKYDINFNYSTLNDTLISSGSTIYNNTLGKLYQNIINVNEDYGVSFHPLGYVKGDNYSLLFVSVENNDVIKLTYDSTSKTVKEELLNKSITMFIAKEFIMNRLNDEGMKYINTIYRSKSLMYNRLAINAKEVPLIVILGFEYGLTTVLERYNVDYVFSNSMKKSNILQEDLNRIKFKNGYLYYSNNKLRNSLLLSGLGVIDTEEYEFLEFNKSGSPYMDYFDDNYGSRNTGKGFHNSLSLFLDNKTKEVLKTLNLPTNMLDVLLYTNTLLENNYYADANDRGNFRLRGAEQVSGLLYKVVADAVRTYKDTSKSGNPIKITVPQDIVLKKLMEQQNVSNAPRINPSSDIESKNTTTYKGVSGINLDDAFTPALRSFGSSSKGIFGFGSPVSDKVGVVRTLAYDPSIMNTLGFLEPDKEDKNGNTNMYTTAELLSPFTSTSADPPRKLRFT